MDLNDNNNANFCRCGYKKLYSAEFDSYYCEKCNEWLEDVCTDRDYVYCNNQPNRPKEIND